ncbi:MAG: Fe-S cluster assembly protein SufD [Acidobacteria bacterium]|nr:Fe-S cluster assembly protein SufD [Acidobacteriota bacterium]
MAQVAKEKNSNFSAYKILAGMREGMDPAWLAALRAKAGARFEEIDFPTTRNEEWKYTNVAPILKVPYREIFDLDADGLTVERIAPFTFIESRHSQMVFINGIYSKELSDLSGLPESAVVTSLAGMTEEQALVASRHLAAYAKYQDDAFTALNTAHIVDGALVYIPDGKIVETPVHVLFISTSEEASATHPRVLIIAGKGAMATIIESYVSTEDNVYLTNAVTEVFAAEESAITHYRLQEESEKAFHVATTQVHQERESNYVSYAFSLGAEIARHTLNVVLTDEHTYTTIDGLYVVTGKQHVDNHTTMDHSRPNCTSHQLYKGILDGKSRAVFNGKVLVREGALLTDAHQLNKNLLLSKDSSVDTKPQLEIFADDVKCSHGATVGQLEDDELFYLASRGIAPEQARALLTFGFAEDVISKIKLKSVRKQLDKTVLDKLHQSLELE